jgi:hypothetical protein
LVTFFLAKQKKVTSCRATPGEVDFYFDVGLREKTANPTYVLVIRANGLTSVGCIPCTMVHGMHPTKKSVPFADKTGSKVLLKFG